MDDLLEKAKSQQGKLEEMASKLPIYAGYKEKELRRETDRILRQRAHERRARVVIERSCVWWAERAVEYSNAACGMNRRDSEVVLPLHLDRIGGDQVEV